MKTCRKCELPFPLDDFYTHKQMADGHLNICKSCVKKRVEKHREDNIESIREYDRMRGGYEHRKQHVREYHQTDRGRERSNHAKKVWCERNPRKRAAEVLFANSVKSGKLARLPCEVCGSNIRIHGHHESYDRRLEVRWLCPKHHSERHKEMRSLGIIP